MNLTWLTTKVAGWIIVGLLAALVATGTAVAVQTIRLDAAQTTVDGLKSTITGIEAQRDTTIAANTGYHDLVGRLAKKLQDAIAETERVRAEGEDAVKRAEAARADADRTLDGFMSKFANRAPSCDAALRQMEAACPALSDY